MSVQSIINRASQISITRNRVASKTVSRSGRILTAELPSAVPYQFSVQCDALIPYADARSIIEDLDTMDITREETINIGNTNPALNYITAYQGDISTAQLNNISCVGSSGANLYINTSSVSGSGVLFRKGDIIQPGGSYRYPYTVTADVNFSVSSNVTIPVHRPVLSQSGYTLAGSTLKVGPAVSWQVKQVKKAQYQIVPGRFVRFADSLELIEIIL